MLKTSIKTKQMQKFLNSRTMWTLIVALLFVELPIFQEVIPAIYFKAIMAAILLLAGYFKLNPSQDYGTPSNTAE